MRQLVLLALPLAIAIAMGGCATVGGDFDSTNLAWVKEGETAKSGVLEKLGSPFRVGVDAGYQTWTYGYYKYRLFGRKDAKDLVFKFDSAGKVKSYTLNTTFQEEKETLDPAAKEE